MKCSRITFVFRILSCRRRERDGGLEMLFFFFSVGGLLDFLYLVASRRSIMPVVPLGTELCTCSCLFEAFCSSGDLGVNI